MANIENSNLDTSGKSIPNEEVVDELAKSLEKSALQVDDDDSKNSHLDEDKESETSEGPSQNNEESDLIDEDALREAENSYTEEEKEKLRDEAQEHKSKGNDLFKAGNYLESAESYTLALRMCPLKYSKERAIMYANRAAAKIKLERYETALDDCSKAVELDGSYVKAWTRKAQTLEKLDKLDEALEDYKKILAMDPNHREAAEAIHRLPQQIQERNEKLKEEMLGKLKDLGNMILRPFGLSTENFQMSKDPNSGGYSVNFKSNPN
ncbi:hypothetical protein J437_LFUL010821 [Ladona fulva]|uniref:Tetratricopeptide repeat protein 1 n=1 Tax=Ladona fulva TaxID=123851 RepID=A0A8K0P026_LADFU|nr:hypothetical protein J437_LFUL010821 [Ladona fulva]